MSDQPVDIRTSLVAMLSDMENATTLTADDLSGVNDTLNTLYEMSGQNEEVGALCTQVLGRAQSLVEVSNANLFKAVSMGGIAATALEQAEGERRARVELEDALANNDLEHPLVADHAELVEEAMDKKFRDEWEKALEENYGILRAGLRDRIQRLTWFRLDPFVVTQFVDTLLVSGIAFPPNELQREMLAELVGSFADEKVRNGA